MAQPYDPKKAATFNKLRQQGLSEDAAAAQAGIPLGDGNYVISGKFNADGTRNPNPGTMGADVQGSNKVAGVDYDNISAADAAENARFDRGLESSSNFEQVDFQVEAKNPPGKVTPINYVTTSTETVSGGGSTTITAGPKVSTASSQAVQPAINAKQAEIDAFNKDNPSPFARKKQGLPPLTPEENQARIAKQSELNDQRTALVNGQTELKASTPPTITTVPNTTTTTQTVTTGTSSTNQAVNPETDQQLSQQNETQLAATRSFANASNPSTAPPVASGLPPPNTAPTAAAAQELLTEGQGGLGTQNLENIVGAQQQIEISQANIQQSQAASLANQQSVVDAQAIIAQNNAELADDNLSESRRAVLEANNAENAAVIAQAEQNIATNTNNIELSQSNINENELVIDANADGYAAYSGVGITPPPVSPEEDPFEQSRLEAEQQLNDEPVEFEPADVDPEEDPFEQSRLDAEQQLNDQPIEFDPADVDPEDDPFEAERLEREQELNRQELAVEANEPEPVSPEDDPFEAERLEREQQFNDEPVEFEPADVDPEDDPFEAERLEREQELNRQELAETATEAEPVDTSQDPGLSDDEILARRNPGGLSDEEILDRQANAAQKSAINQATLQARYKQPSNDDWRVRLSLSIGADYLYKASPAEQGILAPLAKTDGVVFPYTPTIETSYVANYTKTELTHSNYRGAFYQNSSVQDVIIRGMFTAQDTSEAAYMLAVIHFFRSVTKMFYGKDSQRGAPPPLVYLSGFGDFQFAGHPCVVTNFSYSLPSDVDYIRANNPNNYGTDLLNRRAAALSSPTPFSGQQARQSILNSVGVFFGAPPTKPTQSPITQTVANTARATYVPTKIEISITLLPMQTRDQISKQFSVKDFANGKLIQGGFW
jgi:hypothetical protein